MNRNEKLRTTSRRPQIPGTGRANPRVGTPACFSGVIYTHATPEAMGDAVNRLGETGDVLEFRARKANVLHNSANSETAAVGE